MVLILLHSSTSGNSVSNSNTFRIENTLNGKKIIFDKIDGCLDENYEIREFLFNLAGKRHYPLIFKYENDKFSFYADYEIFESLIDTYAI